jgi:hypothetical protein
MCGCDPSAAAPDVPLSRPHLPLPAPLLQGLPPSCAAVLEGSVVQVAALRDRALAAYIEEQVGGGVAGGASAGVHAGGGVGEEAVWVLAR